MAKSGENFFLNHKLWTIVQSWLETRATRKAWLAFDYLIDYSIIWLFGRKVTSARQISQNSCNVSLLSMISNLEILFLFFFHFLKITLRSVLAPKFSFHYNPGAKKIDVIRSSFHRHQTKEKSVWKIQHKETQWKLTLSGGFFNIARNQYSSKWLWHVYSAAQRKRQ